MLEADECVSARNQLSPVVTSSRFNRTAHDFSDFMLELIDKLFQDGEFALIARSLGRPAASWHPHTHSHRARDVSLYKFKVSSTINVDQGLTP